MPKLTFYKSRKVRNAVKRNMEKEVRKLYVEAYQELKDRVDHMKTTGSYAFQKVQLQMLQKDIEKNIGNVTKRLSPIYSSGMRDISQATVDDMKLFLGSVGMPQSVLQRAMLGVPDKIVENIITGRVYDKRWYLSEAIWGHEKRVVKDTESIIAKGLAENQDIYTIAKNLEKYVNPSAQKAYKKSKEFFGVYKSIDYNALRLARTLAQHSYQQSFVQTTQPNPFIEYYIWHISSSDLTCTRCIDLSEANDYGLGAGAYPKGELPIDHPNGMCWWEAYIPDSLSSISDRIVEWINSPEGTFPELDEYGEWLENN